mmetsp:Transcript_106482/g.266876  ORF Transcript_106482/g.266876 Transcript_106482/m.266876 type:complete len:209 (-) Transcript_106482:243-869(-)
MRADTMTSRNIRCAWSQSSKRDTSSFRHPVGSGPRSRNPLSQRTSNIESIEYLQTRPATAVLVQPMYTKWPSAAAASTPSQAATANETKINRGGRHASTMHRKPDKNTGGSTTISWLTILDATSETTTLRRLVLSMSTVYQAAKKITQLSTAQGELLIPLPGLSNVFWYHSCHGWVLVVLAVVVVLAGPQKKSAQSRKSHKNLLPENW